MKEEEEEEETINETEYMTMTVSGFIWFTYCFRVVNSRNQPVCLAF